MRTRGRRTTRAPMRTAAARLLLGEDGELRPLWWEAVRESAPALRAPADPRAALALLQA